MDHVLKHKPGIPKSSEKIDDIQMDLELDRESSALVPEDRERGFTASQVGGCVQGVGTLLSSRDWLQARRRHVNRAAHKVTALCVPQTEVTSRHSSLEEKAQVAQRTWTELGTALLSHSEDSAPCTWPGPYRGLHLKH